MSISKAVARAWTDARFKDKLLSQPNAALAEAGVELPEGVQINFVENTAYAQHVVLPAAPQNAGGFTADELEKVAAGMIYGKAGYG